MSYNTTIQTKKEFLEMLDNTIGDDDVILWTQNASVFELKKKYKEKRVSFGFSTDAFERKDGVGDLMKNRGLFATLICNKSILSEAARSLLPANEQNNKP